VYLAGPDVFFPDAPARGRALKAICAEHGLLGLFPLDGEVPGQPDAASIAAANEALIRSSDAVIANLSPFRGASADSGTAFEVGFARALGKPVFGYTLDPRPYEDRCAAPPVNAAPDRAGTLRDADGLEVERFGLAENLMIACGLAFLALPPPGAALPAADLSLFRRCVTALAGRRRQEDA